MAPRFEPARAGGPLVSGFDRQGRFIVDGERHHALLLTPARAIAWDPPPLTALTFGDFEPLLDLDPRPGLILFGSGKTLSRLPQPVRHELMDRGIAFEAMDSRTAARTWAVLRAEERWIAAALLPVQA